MTPVWQKGETFSLQNTIKTAYRNTFWGTLRLVVMGNCLIFLAGECGDDESGEEVWVGPFSI